MGKSIGQPHAVSVANLESKAFTFKNKQPYSKAVSVTTQQANSITNVVEQNAYNNLKADYDAATTAASGWDSLMGNQQTAILDIAYNIGLQRHPAVTGHYGIEDTTLWPLLVKHDWSKAASRILRLGINANRALTTRRL